jgi:hypothetical protein
MTICIYALKRKYISEPRERVSIEGTETGPRWIESGEIISAEISSLARRFDDSTKRTE